MEVDWGDHAGDVCLRLTGDGPGGPDGSVAGPQAMPALRVYPTELIEDRDQPTVLPPMAGQAGTDESGLWFVPRFGFVAGTSYTVYVGYGRETRLTIVRPPRPIRPATSVTGVHPSATSIPYNQLRLYIHFSAPMSEGGAAEHIHVVDDAGGYELVDAVLPPEPELWDRGRRRLTLMFDPARLKRGLVPHEQAGYPLLPGRAIRVVVDRDLADAAGQPLGECFEHRYDVGPDVREHISPSRWKIAAPEPATCDPLIVDFDRPLDHGLLLRSLVVRGPGGRSVPGSPAVGPEERSWAFVPAVPWPAGRHYLVVDPRLEDLAGNSMVRVFDRDLERRQDDPRAARAVRLPFVVTG